MKAMILAAGKGTRVAPFTLDAPKPLLKVLGEPVIDRILGFLKRNHVEDVVLNTSYLGDKLQSYLGDGSRYNMSFTFSYEGVKSNGQMISKPLGSAGGLREVQQRYGCFDSTFMVICGDAIIDFDLDYALAFHKSRNSLATVLTKEVPWNKVSAYGVVDQTESGQILRFQEKPSQEEAVSNKVSTGIYLFEPEIFDYIPEHGEYDIGGELLPLLARMGEPLHGCETPMQWIDIGTVSDLWNANQSALNQDILHFPMKGTEVAPGVFAGTNVNANWDTINVRGPVYIGSGTTIEDGVTIEGPVLISENTHVESGSTLRKCVIDPYTQIEGGTEVNQEWINPEFSIDLSEKPCVSKDTDKTRASDIREARTMSNVSVLPQRAKG